MIASTGDMRRGSTSRVYRKWSIPLSYPWLCQVPEERVEEQLLPFTRGLPPWWVIREMHPTVGLWDGFTATWDLPFYDPPLCLLRSQILYTPFDLWGDTETTDFQLGNIMCTESFNIVYSILCGWIKRAARSIFAIYTMIGLNFKGAAYVLLRITHRKSSVLLNNTREITCNECI